MKSLSILLLLTAPAFVLALHDTGSYGMGGQRTSDIGTATSSIADTGTASTASDSHLGSGTSSTDSNLGSTGTSTRRFGGTTARPGLLGRTASSVNPTISTAEDFSETETETDTETV